MYHYILQNTRRFILFVLVLTFKILNPDTFVFFFCLAGGFWLNGKKNRLIQETLDYFLHIIQTFAGTLCLREISRAFSVFDRPVLRLEYHCLIDLAQTQAYCHGKRSTVSNSLVPESSTEIVPLFFGSRAI